MSSVATVAYHGLALALVTAEEATDHEWTAAADGVDVVRVEHPDPGSWPYLRRAGFVPKPQFVTWVAAALGNDDEYLASLPKRERQKVRLGRKHVAELGIAIEVRPVEEELFDSFLALYEQQIGEMRHGVLMATEQRDDVLADAAPFTAVCARRDETLVGGCIAEADPEKDLVRVRWSAVAPEYRDTNLARVLYLEAAELTRGLGLRLFSLGTDRNLYGHLTSPGLFRFKSHLGLAPQPSHFLYTESGCDQADLVLRLGELTDPTLVLGYADDTPTARLRLHAFSTRAELSLDAYRAPFLEDLSVRVVAREADA